MRNLIAESHRLVEALNADITAGASSARVSIAKTNHVSVVVRTSSVATDFGFKIQEHTLATAGTTQDVVSSMPVYFKADADNKLTRQDESGVAQVTITELNGDAGLVQIEIDCGDLTDGFEFISIAFDAAVRDVDAMYLLDTHNKPGYLHEL